MAHNNPAHLNKLISAINSPEDDIFIHIDKKSSVKFNIPNSNNIHIVKNNIKVYWGSFTFVEAVLKLITTALRKDTYNYFILLSGGDYPVRNKSFIKKYIKNNLMYQFINFARMPENNKSLDRVKYFYISTYEKIFRPDYIFKRLVNLIILKLKISRKYPQKYSGFLLYGGSTWWAMSSDCIKYVVNFIDHNPKFVNFYKNTFIPEEMFFQTIIGNSKFKKSIRKSFTYADWPNKNSSHPASIKRKHVDFFYKQVMKPLDNENIFLFARKFNDNSDQEVNLINKKLLNLNI